MGSRVDVMGYGHPTAVYITSNKTKVNTNKDKHDLMSEKYFARQVGPTLATSPSLPVNVAASTL